MSGQTGSRTRWLVLAALLAIAVSAHVQRVARHSPSFMQVAEGAYRWGLLRQRAVQAAPLSLSLERGLGSAICCAGGLCAQLVAIAAPAAAPACRLPHARVTRPLLHPAGSRNTGTCCQGSRSPSLCLWACFAETRAG